VTGVADAVCHSVGDVPAEIFIWGTGQPASVSPATVTDEKDLGAHGHGRAGALGRRGRGPRRGRCGRGAGPAQQGKFVNFSRRGCSRVALLVTCQRGQISGKMNLGDGGGHRREIASAHEEETFPESDPRDIC
jgi:hypothetical protein